MGCLGTSLWCSTTTRDISSLKESINTVEAARVRELELLMQFEVVVRGKENKHGQCAASAYLEEAEELQLQIWTSNPYR